MGICQAYHGVPSPNDALSKPCLANDAEPAENVVIVSMVEASVT